MHPLWNDPEGAEYREPFFGAGAVGVQLFKKLPRKYRVWINDADPGIAAMWRTVKNNPRELCNKVDSFIPRAEYFELYKAEDGRQDIDDIEAGFRKLALHRISFSGLGAMAGSAIGGKNQNNEKYPVGCRWRPDKIQREIGIISKRMNQFAAFRITSGDYAPLVETADDRCFVYLDPPYYEKGSQLYKYSMDDADHVRLANMLKSSPCKWVLSYDDHPRIRELYDWAAFHNIHLTYTISNKHDDGTRPKNREVVIVPIAA
jgi:DNA adenine methylase